MVVMFVSSSSTEPGFPALPIRCRHCPDRRSQARWQRRRCEPGHCPPLFDRLATRAARSDQGLTHSGCCNQHQYDSHRRAADRHPMSRRPRPHRPPLARDPRHQPGRSRDRTKWLPRRSHCSGRQPGVHRVPRGSARRCRQCDRTLPKWRWPMRSGRDRLFRRRIPSRHLSWPWAGATSVQGIGVVVRHVTHCAPHPGSDDFSYPQAGCGNRVAAWRSPAHFPICPLPPTLWSSGPV